MKKIGIFVGNFHPITNAHLIVANESLSFVDQVWFCPFNGEHINQINELLEISIKEAKEKRFFRFDASTVEFSDFNNLHFFLEQIEELHKEDQMEFVLIVGADAYLKMPTWKKALEINKKYKFIIAKRGEKDNFNKKEEDVIIESFTTISSEIVRERINKRKSVKFMVSEGVCKYLKKNKIKFSS